MTSTAALNPFLCRGVVDERGDHLIRGHRRSDPHYRIIEIRSQCDIADIGDQHRASRRQRVAVRALGPVAPVRGAGQQPQRRQRRLPQRDLAELVVAALGVGLAQLGGHCEGGAAHRSQRPVGDELLQHGQRHRNVNAHQ